MQASIAVIIGAWAWYLNTAGAGIIAILNLLGSSLALALRVMEPVGQVDDDGEGHPYAPEYEGGLAKRPDEERIDHDATGGDPGHQGHSESRSWDATDG